MSAKWFPWFRSKLLDLLFSHHGSRLLSRKHVLVAVRHHLKVITILLTDGSLIGRVVAGTAGRHCVRNRRVPTRQVVSLTSSSPEEAQRDSEKGKDTSSNANTETNFCRIGQSRSSRLFILVGFIGGTRGSTSTRSPLGCRGLIGSRGRGRGGGGGGGGGGSRV